MPKLNIEGIDKPVTVDENFLKLDPFEQQKVANDIAAQYQSRQVKSVASDIQKTSGGDDLEYRSTILPLGKTKEGNIVPAIPGAIKSLIDLPQQFIEAGQAGSPGSREVTEAAIAPATETALALTPTSAGGKVARAILKRPEIPTTDELHAAGTAAYNAVKASGAQIKPEPFVQMVIDTAKELGEEGFDKDIQPKANAAVRRLAEAAASRKETSSPVDIGEFQKLRRIAQAAAKSNESDERRIAGIIKGNMDDFLAGLSKNDVVGGDPEAASANLKEANRLWARYSKSSEIDRLFENASLSAGNYNAAGYENALRNEFKTLAKNKNRIRKFSPDEQEAIKAVAKGSKLQTAFTKLGKFSPTSGFFAMVIGGEIGAHAFSNPELLAIPGIGAIAKYAATKLRERTAEGARKIVAGGKEAADYVKQKTAIRQKAISGRSQLGRLGGLFGGEDQSRTRITIPLDPNNL